MLGDSRLISEVVGALEADDDVVCEAALKACKQLLESAQFADLLAEQVLAARSDRVRQYAAALLREADAA